MLLLLLPPAVWLGLGRPFLALLLWTHPLMSANDMHGNICKNPCLIYSIQAEHLLLWVLRLYWASGFRARLLKSSMPGLQLLRNSLFQRGHQRPQRIHQLVMLPGILAGTHTPQGLDHGVEILLHVLEPGAEQRHILIPGGIQLLFQTFGLRLRLQGPLFRGFGALLLGRFSGLYDGQTFFSRLRRFLSLLQRGGPRSRPRSGTAPSLPG